ncbi:isoamylase early set domain-containing protein [Planobispora longispora]|uniref:Uncharacterized protein n=1 Tax=Planobispora longispora TaxID=28887 RepID=A0A8J3RU51_9ACTN|nr:isoamylase early set domain-containing protein [Planobispora longispora]BFE79374.1 hypothetical protein GCM10020093_019750 [Planobispora longispora]GIH78283.1 hypothetical protein Plo01_47120 [Planobispora longispora]
MIKRGKPAKNGHVKLTFTIPAEQVSGGVSVVGDFNGWDPYAHPMQLRTDTYQVSMTVPADQEICFRYLATGGLWFDDAEADYHDHHGGHLSPIVAQSPEVAAFDDAHHANGHRGQAPDLPNSSPAALESQLPAAPA